jgi:hypothetical protein
MKLWKLAATVALGVFASGSGSLQVNAATYGYQVDFLDKEVADFDDFRQSFNATTYDLNAKLQWTFTGTYYLSSSTPNTSIDLAYQVFYRINGTGSFTSIGFSGIPNFLPNTSPTIYTANIIINLPDAIVLALVNDDANFVEFNSQMFIVRNNLFGRTLYLDNYSQYFNIFYEFDTTYLFNYFLSDQQFTLEARTQPANWTINSTRVNLLEYVYTTAGNDIYLIENSLQVDIGTSRKKYAINVDDIYFRGESVGAQFRTQFVNGVDSYTPVSSSGTETITHFYRYYYLNTSNYQQPIENVPTFEFETEDCGGFLSLNVACFINNALAYIVNDAPVISDAFTLLNAGMRLGGQAFGIIGNFTTDNLFGVMILGGLGITAVRWFLKND